MPTDLGSFAVDLIGALGGRPNLARASSSTPGSGWRAAGRTTTPPSTR
jgi:hypothetical protein